MAAISEGAQLGWTGPPKGYLGAGALGQAREPVGVPAQGKGWGPAVQGRAKLGVNIWPGGGAVMVSPDGRWTPWPPGRQAAPGLYTCSSNSWDSRKGEPGIRLDQKAAGWGSWG